MPDYMCTSCGARHEKRAYGPGYAKFCPNCGSRDQYLTDEAVARIAARTFTSQSARDAQAALVRSKGGACDESYCDYLEETARQYHDKYAARGDTAAAEIMLTRTLSQALMGNDGD